MEVIKGTLDVLILKSLSWGPGHGYAVSRWIRDVTDEALTIEEGALYPALHRLEQRSWIAAEWGVSDNNRRARSTSSPRRAARNSAVRSPAGIGFRRRVESVDRDGATELGAVRG